MRTIDLDSRAKRTFRPIERKRREARAFVAT
jgi:hypothetical protein